MPDHTITAFFDSRAYADEAATALGRVGVPGNQVTLSPVDNDVGPEAAHSQARGFWAMLERFFGGTPEHGIYAEGVRRGGSMLTAHVDDVHLDRTMEILERHGAIDLDEREAAWRSEGWMGDASVPMTSAATDVARMRADMSDGGIATGPLATVDEPYSPPVAAAGPSPLPSTPIPPIVEPASVPRVSAEPAPSVRGTARDEVLQVVEERLNVGKRSVSRGKVRLHSYVVERPVTEQVTLHDETFTLDRHAVDRAVTVDELGTSAFRNRTVEMEEVDEEPVVSKSARVVEEIGLRKEVTSRTETVHDTVRSTKIDVEDERGRDLSAS